MEAPISPVTTKKRGDKSCGFSGQVLESSELAKKQAMFYPGCGLSIYFGESWNNRSIPLEISTMIMINFSKWCKRHSCHTGTVASGPKAIWAFSFACLLLIQSYSSFEFASNEPRPRTRNYPKLGGH
jgi:hypothetical protein